MGKIRRLHPSVVLRHEGDARFALHIERGDVVELNGPAAFLLERLREGADRAALAASLREQYPDADEDDAVRDVDELVAQLDALGFLTTGC